MKKQLITLLMAGLLVVGFGGSALAEDVSGDGTATTNPTNVVTSIEKKIPIGWTVVIPKTIPATDTNIVIKASKINVLEGGKVAVKITNNLVGGKLELESNSSTDNRKIATILNYDGSPIDGQNNVIATFSGKTEIANAVIDPDTSTGTIVADMPTTGNEDKFADTYAGTVTFTAEYVAPVAVP